MQVGCGQLTSQPALIAWMIELLELGAGDRVLESGTGSGNQTAILAELGCVEVYSLEIIPELDGEALSPVAFAPLRAEGGFRGFGCARMRSVGQTPSRCRSLPDSRGFRLRLSLWKVSAGRKAGQLGR
ncbi:MAG: hypothetical protein IT318_16340 [Anaerolineales bacterium]|nr:hypothetical protein [Anaerolineales bacterium]